MFTEKPRTRSRVKEENNCIPCKKVKSSHDKEKNDAKTQSSSRKNKRKVRNFPSETMRKVKLPDKISQISLYEMKKVERVNIKVKAHRYEKPDVFAMSILASGDVLLADHAITSLLLLDHKTYKVKPAVELPAKPHCVCNVNKDEVVTALSNDTLQFISVHEEKFALTRSVQLNHLCLGVGVAFDQLYVTDGQNGHLYIYGLDGTLVKEIKENSCGQDIFTWNRFIAIGEGENTLHVTDREKCLVTIDRNGNVVRQVTVPVLKGAFGICTDGKGNLFVTGYMSNNVVQVDQNGIDHGEVISSDYCVSQPKGICFDSQNLKLYVCGNSYDNKIHIFTLHR